VGSDEPGPGQAYALEARRHIATIRRRRPEVTIELHWCPAPKGVPGNEEAYEWAKLATDEPDLTVLNFFDLGGTATLQGKDGNPLGH